MSTFLSPANMHAHAHEKTIHLHMLPRRADPCIACLHTGAMVHAHLHDSDVEQRPLVPGLGPGGGGGGGDAQGSEDVGDGGIATLQALRAQQQGKAK